MKAITSACLALALAIVGRGVGPKHNYVPEDGYVPNKDVAIKVAVAVWEPIYGAKKIEAEKPFRAKLAEGVWLVEGSLPDGMKGGVALAEISKVDGRIIRVSHGK